MKKRITFSVATLILTASLLAIPAYASRKIATEIPTTTSSNVVTSTTETEEMTVSASEASGKKTQTTKNNKHKKTTISIKTTSTTKETTTTNANSYSNNIKSTTTTSTTTSLTTTTSTTTVTTTAEPTTTTSTTTVTTTEPTTTTSATTVTTTAEPATTMPVTTTIPEMPENAIWVPRWKKAGETIGPIEVFIGPGTQENVDLYQVVLDFDLPDENHDSSNNRLKKSAGVFTTSEHDWFMFGHSTGIFIYLDQLKEGDYIFLNLDGELKKFVIQLSQSGKLTDDKFDILDASSGASLIRNLPTDTDEVMSIKFITCYQPLSPISGCDNRWIVVATATE